jgi:hypothetical protein
MPHIKLTETDYIDPETIAHVTTHQRYGSPCVEVFFKSEHLDSLMMRGEEANVAWANWKAFMVQPKQ